jgi:large subunit ribosomal protein L18
MAKNRRSNVQYRRKRTTKTDYRQRLGLLKSGSLRLIVRRRDNSFIVQLVEFKESKDNIVSSVSKKDLETLGWKFNQGNTPSAYLLGLLIGSKNKDKNAILDLGLQRNIKGNSIYAVAKGAQDAGLKINLGNISPNPERLTGKHIADYAKHLKENNQAYEKQFSKYIKNSINIEDIEKNVEEIKNKILKEK